MRVRIAEHSLTEDSRARELADAYFRHSRRGVIVLSACAVVIVALASWHLARGSAPSLLSLVIPAGWLIWFTLRPAPHEVLAAGPQSTAETTSISHEPPAAGSN